MKQKRSNSIDFIHLTDCSVNFFNMRRSCTYNLIHSDLSLNYLTDLPANSITVNSNVKDDFLTAYVDAPRLNASPPLPGTLASQARPTNTQC